jgi:single-strand DNA-binding protein
MASINKCIFIGNVTRDIEMKYAASGDAIANFSIACNETWKDKSGAKQERVEYVNLVAYRKLAEIIGEYVKKATDA